MLNSNSKVSHSLIAEREKEKIGAVGVRVTLYQRQLMKSRAHLSLLRSSENREFEADWLVYYFVFNGLLNNISVYIGPSPKRGRKKRKKMAERKNAQTTTLAPIASTIGTCPTIVQISRTPDTECLASTFVPPDQPCSKLSDHWKILSTQQ